MKKIIIMLLLITLVACGSDKEVDDNNEIVKKEEIVKDDDGYTIVEPGYEVQLATVKMMPIGFEEYEIDEAKKGVKVKLQLTNTTKYPFEFSGLSLFDDQDRMFVLDEDYFNYDDNLYYLDLAPGIPETGYLYFVVPTDSESYHSKVMHAETEKNYKLMYQIQE